MSSVARTAATVASPTTPVATAIARSARARRQSARLAAREADLLPVWPISIVVFTLPAEIAAIAYQNKAVVYDLLFKRRGRDTLLAIDAADPEHLGARIGSTAGAAQLGLGDDRPSACARDRAGRRASRTDGSRWVAPPSRVLPLTSARIVPDLFRRLRRWRSCSPPPTAAGRLGSSWAAIAHLGQCGQGTHAPSWRLGSREALVALCAKLPIRRVPRRRSPHLARYTAPRRHREQPAGQASTSAA